MSIKHGEVIFLGLLAEEQIPLQLQEQRSRQLADLGVQVTLIVLAALTGELSPLRSQSSKLPSNDLFVDAMP